MARPRTPQGSLSRRQRETAKLRTNWEKLKVEDAREQKCSRQMLTSGRSQFYRHLWIIYEATQSEVLAAALSELEIYGLDKPNWTASLERLARFEHGGSEADFAIAAMKPFIENEGYSAIRAAERAASEMGLFRRANSFNAAVRACQTAWIAYKKGRHAPITATSYFVQPVAESLAPGQVRQLRDPRTMQLLPPEGMEVEASVYWSKAIELGFVKV